MTQQVTALELPVVVNYSVGLRFMVEKNTIQGASMKYMLVLQFIETMFVGYNTMLDIEDCLVEALGSEHYVDGHDYGIGEMNIFIITSEPEGAFKECIDAIAAKGLTPAFKAAYRDMEEKVYTVIWPEGYHGEFSVS
jgi:hypothetical protein